MKRLMYLVILLCFVQINVIHASEHGQRRNDIVFINNTSVDSCHLSNGYEYIFIDELLKVGFDININENRIDINRNYNKKFDNSNEQKIDTSIVDENFELYLDNTLANSFRVKTDKGYEIVIQSDELSKYGTFFWNYEMGKIFLDIGGYNSTIIDFPYYTEFKNVFGLKNIDDLVKGTIVLESGQSAQLSDYEAKKILSSFWDFNMMRYTEPFDDFITGYTYFNFYDKNNNKYTIFNSGKIICSNFGDGNSIWYMPYIGNARGSLYSLLNQLEQKYRPIATLSDETPNVLTTYDNLNFRLPKNEKAIDEIKEAASSNLLPYELTKDYEKAITREEFCNLVSYMLNQIYQKNSPDYYVNVNLRYILEDMGLGSVQNVSFSDYEAPSSAVNDLYIMGIIKGKGENIFEPYGFITYEETAQLLYNVAKVFISKDIMKNTSSDYSTKHNISEWAKEAVSWIVQNEIMPDNFDTQLNITREQAIISINRLYKFYRKYY